jgi:uncharacterized protein YndB with AHSA1/START domain
VADILHDFPVSAPIDRVFAAVSTPAGLDQWWTQRSLGSPRLGAEYELGFGPGYDWRGRLTRCTAPEAIEYELTRADSDWTGTRVGFALSPAGSGTQVRFHHTGWPQTNEHYRTSSYCWAMYLRVLKRSLEFGESVPYDQRLEV